MSNYELLRFFADKEGITLSTVSSAIGGHGHLHKRLLNNSITLKTHAKIVKWLFANFPAPTIIWDLEPALGSQFVDLCLSYTKAYPVPVPEVFSDKETRELFYIPRKKSSFWEFTPYRIWTPSVNEKAKLEIAKALPSLGFWMHSWEGQTLIIYRYEKLNIVEFFGLEVQQEQVEVGVR